MRTPDPSRDLPLLLERLVPALLPERVYLFGSYARGDFGPDSDYDLMLVVPDDADPHRVSSRQAYMALSGSGIGADVLVWRKTKFDDLVPFVASLPATIMREGKLVYATSAPHASRRFAPQHEATSTFCIRPRPEERSVSKGEDPAR